MIYRHVHHHNHFGRYDLYVYINGGLKLIIKNIKKMANVIIDIEDNQSDLTTAVDAVSSAITALEGATLSGVADALAALNTAQSAISAFKISFTASVPAQ